MNFPESPTIGQQYTLGSKTWEWNGYAWDLLSISETQVERAETAAMEAINAAAEAANAVLGTTLTGLDTSTDEPITTTDKVLGAFGKLQAQISSLLVSIGLLAPKDSPTFTGTVTGITKEMVGLGNVDNVSAADLRDRSTHTGTQPASTITGLAAVATSGSYNDLLDKPSGSTIPGNATPTQAGLMSATDKAKLDGIADEATKNASDDYLLNRANHTGTQPASTITGLATVATSGSYNDLDDKPDIPAAQVPADWDATSGVAQILNKPSAMSQEEAETGTDTTPRLIDASVLKAAIIEHGSGGSGGGSYQTGDLLTTARTLSAPDWLLTDGAAYLRSAYPDLAMLFPAMTKLTNPADLPPNTGFGCAFSPDGTYLSVTHNTSPYITIYKRSGDTFTKLVDPAVTLAGTGRGCAFSPDGTYLSVAHGTSPFITIYKRSGDTFTKLPNPTDLPPNAGNGCAFSPDGMYLSVVHSSSPFITIYKRSGDTFTKLANPSTLPASTGFGCAFSPDGTYLSVAHANSPSITIYKRSGDTFTKLANPADLPVSTGNGCAFSPDGTYLGVAHQTSPYITIYKRSGDTFTKLVDPADLPTGIGNSCAFSPDGTYLSVVHQSSPYITIYKRFGDTFIKLANPADLLTGNGNSCAFSPDGAYMSVAHANSPHITIYTNVGGEDEATTFTTPSILYPKTNTYIKS